MSATNCGNQVLTWDYKNPLTAETFNTSLRGGISPGIASGALTKIDNVTVEVSPYLAYIPVDSDKIIRVETSLPVQVNVTSATPIVYLSYSWANQIENWADYGSKAEGSFNENHVIIGKVTFSGASIIGFDYTAPLNRTPLLFDQTTKNLTGGNSFYNLYYNTKNSYAIYGQADGCYGIYGKAANYSVYGCSTVNYGVTGRAVCYGIYGYASDCYGICGEANNRAINANATIDYGIIGCAGRCYGVHGVAATSFGVYGIAVDFGVYGRATGSYGICGQASDIGIYGCSENNCGVKGNATGSYGVYGSATAFGVYGTATNYGVYGAASVNYGVIGTAGCYAIHGTASGNYAVYGTASGSYGVYGSATCYGVYGTATDTHGVVGVATNACGVVGCASTHGVVGSADSIGVLACASGNTGLYASANNYAIWASSALCTIYAYSVYEHSFLSPNFICIQNIHFWSSSSYTKYKEPVSLLQCLDKNPLSVYKYLYEDTKENKKSKFTFTEDITPTAQDFYKTFRLHQHDRSNETIPLFSLAGISLGIGIELYSCIKKLEKEISNFKNK
jgi:hypothetical protein